MVFIVFSCTTPQGEYQKCTFGGADMESCFQTRNTLVASGWQLHEVYLSESAGKYMALSIKAFDGEGMDAQLVKLQRTWEIILRFPNYFLRAQEAQKQAHHQHEERKRRVEILFERMDTMQAHILETKAMWGVM